MKPNFLSLLALAMLVLPLRSIADENIGEKANKEVNTATRNAKKQKNRASEAACKEGDVKCTEKKVKHRSEEGSDYIKDKSEEAKDKID